MTDTPSRRGSFLLLAGILLIAMNLRAPFTSVAPLLEQLRTDFALSATEAGMLITLPLLAFAGVSPFAAGLAARWGLERTLLLALAIIAAGILLRADGHALPLYAGTAVIGAGIALGNVLLPSLLKRDFPDRVAPLTGLYVLAMGVAAAASSAVVVPLTELLHSDWRVVSRVPVGLTALAALAWLPQMRRKVSSSACATTKAVSTHGAVWRSPLAWQVTAFLGLDCFLYYVGVSWLPSILHDLAGYSAGQAASLHGLLLLATAIPGLILIPLAPRLQDQRAAACVLALCMVAGLLGFVLAPVYALIWIVVFGIGAGGGLILALVLISLRTTNAQDAGALSGMAQCVGYFIAAAGPALVGKAHDVTASWATPLGICAGLGVVMAVFGLLAGRNLQIGSARAPRPVTATRPGASRASG